MSDDPWAEFYQKPPTIKQQDDPWASFTSKPTVQKAKDQSYSKDLAYGLENDILRGSANTLKQYGYPETAGYLSGAADIVHKAAGLDTYSPDGGDTSLIGRLSNIPHTLTQGAPGMAQDIAAGAAGTAVGGPAAGLLAFGGSYGLRHLGEVKDRIREAAGKGPNDELSTSEQLRAGGGLLADVLLNRFGIGKVIKPGPVKKVGLEAAPEIAKRTVEGVATGAGVGGGQTILDSAVYDQKAPDLSDTVVNAVTGGVAGAAGSIPNITKESMRAARFRSLAKLPQDSVANVANKIAEVDKAGSTNVEKDTAKLFNADIANAVADNAFKAQVRANTVANGGIDTTSPLLRTISTKLGLGHKLDPAELNALRNEVGGTQEGDTLVQAVIDRNTVNHMAPLYNGGLSNTGFGKLVAPFGSKLTNVMDLGILGALTNGHHLPYIGSSAPYVAGGLLAAQGLGFAATRGLDRLSGASNPTKVILDKYLGNTGTPPVTTTPFIQQQNQQAFQQAAAQHAAQQAQQANISTGPVNTVPTPAQMAKAQRIQQQFNQANKTAATNQFASALAKVPDDFVERPKASPPAPVTPESEIRLMAKLNALTARQKLTPSHAPMPGEDIVTPQRNPSQIAEPNPALEAKLQAKLDKQTSKPKATTEPDVQTQAKVAIRVSKAKNKEESKSSDSKLPEGAYIVKTAEGDKIQHKSDTWASEEARTTATQVATKNRMSIWKAAGTNDG